MATQCPTISFGVIITTLLKPRIVLIGQDVLKLSAKNWTFSTSRGYTIINIDSSPLFREALRIFVILPLIWFLKLIKLSSCWFPSLYVLTVYLALLYNIRVKDLTFRKSEYPWAAKQQTSLLWSVREVRFPLPTNTASPHRSKFSMAFRKGFHRSQRPYQMTRIFHIMKSFKCCIFRSYFLRHRRRAFFFI